MKLTQKWLCLIVINFNSKQPQLPFLYFTKSCSLFGFAVLLPSCASCLIEPGLRFSFERTLMVWQEESNRELSSSASTEVKPKGRNSWSKAAENRPAVNKLKVWQLQAWAADLSAAQENPILTSGQTNKQTNKQPWKKHSSLRVKYCTVVT